MSSLRQGGRVDISTLQMSARMQLINLLEKCPGPKAIVWDQSLAGPFGLIAQYSMLKEHSTVKIYPLRLERLTFCDVKHLIFISRPKLHLMEMVTRNIRDDIKYCKENGLSEKRYHLFFVPNKSFLCENKLKHDGVYGSLTIEEFNCILFPFDSDLLSMEIPEVLKDYYLENDPTCLYQIAQAITLLQDTYGPISRVWGKGPAAKQVWNLVNRLRRENDSSKDDKTHVNSNIDQMILIDRTIDFISPLVTQLTYEGLIDEIYGINNATANFPAEKFMSSEERVSESLAEDKKQIILNSSDRIYVDLRDKNFNAVGSYLSKEAKSISMSVQMEENCEKSMQELKNYVKRLPHMLDNKKALSKHTAIAECIKETTDSFDFLNSLQVEQEFLNCIDVDKVNPYIEDLIAQKKPLNKLLRLICLQCLTSSGFKPKVLDYYKREICQVYGLEALLILNNLEGIGLLKVQSSSRQYTVLRKTLKLTVADTSEINPTDISYVHSIYAPLSVRLTEQLLKNGGLKQMQDVLGLLPGIFCFLCNRGPTVEESQSNATVNNSDSTKVVLVFYIGGCTFAEISALRFLSQQEDFNVEFIIATTKLINGNTFLKPFMDVID